MHTQSINDDVRSREALEDPYAFYARLREHDPVHWSDASHAWIISSHAEVTVAFADERLASDRLTPMEHKLPPDEREAMAATFKLLRGWMVFADAPDHMRLRTPVRHALAPFEVRKLEAKVEVIVRGLLDDMARGDTCELIESYAFPLPAIVIAELLGVPAEDREEFKQWSHMLAGVVFGAVEHGRYASANEATVMFTEYFETLIRRYEAEPADNLISLLIAARDTGEALPAEHMVGACTMLLFGGHETTASLIANATTTLLQHPEQLALFRKYPTYGPFAVEELMRYCGPALVMVRQVREAHERGGHHLEAGQRVYLSIGGANRDPAMFENPDTFDITRDVNPHLGFGHGLHFCLGASLARMEARVALTALFERFPAMRLTVREPQWGGTVIGRSVMSVPLALR